MPHHQLSVHCSDCNGTGTRIILVNDDLRRTYKEKCRTCEGIGKRLVWTD